MFEAPCAPHAIDSVFATRDALEAWAREHEVAHVLSLAAEVLLDELAELGAQRQGLMYAVGRLSLREVGSLEGAQRYVGSRGFASQVAEVAHRRLLAEAAAVREGLAEEDERRACAPAPELAALWTKLLVLRSRIRDVAVPRSRAMRRTARWSFDARSVSVIWTERDRVFQTGMSWGSTGLVARLAFGRGGEPHLECSCRARDARCTHTLALIDATLDVLADADRRDEARAVAEELLRPGWSRALQDLAQLDATFAPPRAAIEVWWQIEDHHRGLTLAPIVRKQTKRGTLTTGARTTVERLLADHAAQLDERDRQIAEQLAGFAPGTSTYPYRAFAALVGHPRVRTDHGDDAVAVRRVQLGYAALPAGEHITLEPCVDGARFSPRLLQALLGAFRPGEPLVTIEGDGTCLLIDASAEAVRLWEVLAKYGETFPPESHGALLERLAKLEAHMPVSVPRELKGREHAATPIVVVRVRVLPDISLELEAFVRPAPGAPLFPPGAGRRDVMIAGEGERSYVRRELGEEMPLVRGMLARLPPLDAAEEGPPLCFRIDDHDAALALVAALQRPPPGLEAEWIDGKHAVVGTVTPRALRVVIDTKRDWFGIAGEIKLEQGRLELAVLLDAARRQQRFVRLDANRWVELADTLRAKLAAVADQTFTSRDQLELSPGAVPAIDALAEAGVKVTAASAWERLTERLLASQRLSPKPPRNLVGTLRPYQVEGHAWLSRVAAWGAGACLADDMGLGKTVQAIAVLLDRAKLGPALVLAPTSVTLNWVDELRRFAPSLRPVLYTEQTDRTACLASLGKRDVLIASYGLLVRDIAELAKVSLATLVVDEAQALKNATTQRARAARKLDAAFRLALSGTPLENHLGELWSVFAVVFPGLLGSWDQFRDRFAVPIEKHRDPEARAALSRVIGPFLLRRTKAAVAPELPSRTEIQVPIALSEDERALYEDARLAAVAHLDKSGKDVRDEQRRFAVLAALTRLRLLASHPKLYDASSRVGSSKMQRLLELLEELRAGGHRALVFSQFTSHLALVRDEVAHAGLAALYLDGETPARQRAKLIAQFQAGEGDVFLISLKAGGTGINLTAADYVIHLDPWWNPAVEDQATDRAHRIGQTKPVTVYRLIARGTVEAQILHMHADKRALVAQILDGKHVAARLTTRDLLALLAAPTA